MQTNLTTISYKALLHVTKATRSIKKRTEIEEKDMDTHFHILRSLLTSMITGLSDSTCLTFISYKVSIIVTGHMKEFFQITIK